MTVASSGIWFPITNCHQPVIPNRPTDDPPADNGQPIINPHEASSGEPVALDASRSPPRYWSPVCKRTKANSVDGYAQIIADRVRDGWSCHLVTILFSKFPSARSAVIDRMKDEVQRVYSTLLTRVHRKPRTASTDELPVLVGAVDLPVYKWNRSSAPTVFCNGGLHFHALVLVPPSSRLKGSLAEHFEGNSDLYAGSGRSIRCIDVRPVVEGHARVVDYVLKTVLNGRLSYDEAVMVLPRARGEL